MILAKKWSRNKVKKNDLRSLFIIKSGTLSTAWITLLKCIRASVRTDHSKQETLRGQQYCYFLQSNDCFSGGKRWEDIVYKSEFQCNMIEKSKWGQLIIFLVYCLLVFKSHVQTKISLIPVLDRVKVFEIKDTTVLLASGVYFLEWQSQL